TVRNLGVPEATQKLSHVFKYNDIRSLEEIFEKNPKKIAAVIMEPMSYVEPQEGFLKKVKEMAHKNGALLVFDEIITGFRFSLGGAQKLFGVIPDLATFGKSMANGMPISALVGKKEYMEKCEDIFYSFTFGGEALSLAAAIATIKEIERKKVIKDIWEKGKYLQNKTNDLLKKNGLFEFIKVKGKPCWQVFIISGYKDYSDLEIKSYLQQEILQAGFLWYGQHNMSFSHKQKDIDNLLKVYEHVFSRTKELIDKGKLKENLRGEPITNIFKIR
ncbi:aminotransferase class III-fold pyridoxal phosphate-dependent enzyme, partial [Patescibacteria group bacterium]|nr:aminotransferase class III-fold pyridoxal phosphate-dependent enzyme [Patescibacteria group bacterium]